MICNYPNGAKRLGQVGRLPGLYAEGLALLDDCASYVPERLIEQIGQLLKEAKRLALLARQEHRNCTEEEMVVLFSLALVLLSECSGHVPADIVDKMEQLADQTGRFAMPIRYERCGNMLVIDPFNVSG